MARLASSRRVRLGRSRISWAFTPGENPGLPRSIPLDIRAVDGGSVSRLVPGASVGEVEKALDTGPPLLVDLGVVGARGELHQSLGGDEGVVASLCVREEESSGLALGALLTLARADAVALLPGSGILVGVAVDALLPSRA